jgi:hypothetical protein
MAENGAKVSSLEAELRQAAGRLAAVEADADKHRRIGHGPNQGPSGGGGESSEVLSRALAEARAEASASKAAAGDLARQLQDATERSDALAGAIGRADHARELEAAQREVRRELLRGLA